MSLRTILTLQLIQWTFADMEVPEVVGWLPEVCTIDEASVIQCVTSGVISSICLLLKILATII